MNPIPSPRSISSELSLLIIACMHERLLVTFGDGKLSDEEVFKDGGHGVVFLGLIEATKRKFKSG